MNAPPAAGVSWRSGAFSDCFHVIYVTKLSIFMGSPRVRSPRHVQFIEMLYVLYIFLDSCIIYFAFPFQRNRVHIPLLIRYYLHTKILVVLIYKFISYNIRSHRRKWPGTIKLHYSHKDVATQHVASLTPVTITSLSSWQH